MGRNIFYRLTTNSYPHVNRLLVSPFPPNPLSPSLLLLNLVLNLFKFCLDIGVHLVPCSVNTFEKEIECFKEDNRSQFVTLKTLSIPLTA
jgi:hypothetical protein